MKILIIDGNGMAGHMIQAYLQDLGHEVRYTTRSRKKADAYHHTFDVTAGCAIDALGITFHPLVRSVRPLGFFDYVHLQQHAWCVLSDNGTVPEEAAILNYPAVSIRTSTERPETLDAGNIVLGGIIKESILAAIAIATGFYDPARTLNVPDYQDVNVSEKVIKIIQSYIGIVNARIWRK